MKRMVKLIVTSAAYRQSSSIAPGVATGIASIALNLDETVSND